MQESCEHEWVILTRMPCRVEPGVVTGKMVCKHCKKETTYRDEDE